MGGASRNQAGIFEVKRAVALTSEAVDGDSVGVVEARLAAAAVLVQDEAVTVDGRTLRREDQT